jgi:hypothetical protein
MVMAIRQPNNESVRGTGLRSFACLLTRSELEISRRGWAEGIRRDEYTGLLSVMPAKGTQQTGKLHNSDKVRSRKGWGAHRA